MSFFQKTETHRQELVADVYYDEKLKRYKIRLIEPLPMKDNKGRYMTTGIVVNPDQAPNIKKYKTQGEALLAAHAYADRNEGVKVSHKLFPILDA